jgi:hypothetical protein
MDFLTWRRNNFGYYGRYYGTVYTVACQGNHIVRNVRAGNPPRFYSAMREREVKAAERIFAGFAEDLRNGRPAGGMIPEWATGVTTDDFSTRTLESKYDLYQAELIDARITRMVEAGVESDLEDISDGPIGQVPK